MSRVLRLRSRPPRSLRPGSGDGVLLGPEAVLFVLSLPGWIVLMKLHGLYERDEERADHSTVDDLVGVLHIVTLGTWLFALTAHVTQLADPTIQRLAVFWAAAISLVTGGRAVARAAVQAKRHLHPEHGHRRRRRRGTARRAEAESAP